MTRPTRPLVALVAAVASASTAYIAVWVVSSLVVLEITGSAVAAGVPSALAALATAFGAVAVANLGIRWTRPRALAIGFTAAVIGGFGSMPGAVVGGMLLGVIENLAPLYLPSGIRYSVPFLVLIAILLVRPAGLLGRVEQRKV